MQADQRVVGHITTDTTSVLEELENYGSTSLADKSSREYHIVNDGTILLKLLGMLTEKSADRHIKNNEHMLQGEHGAWMEEEAAKLQVISLAYDLIKDNGFISADNFKSQMDKITHNDGVALQAKKHIVSDLIGAHLANEYDVNVDDKILEEFEQWVDEKAACLVRAKTERPTDGDRESEVRSKETCADAAEEKSADSTRKESFSIDGALIVSEAVSSQQGEIAPMVCHPPDTPRSSSVGSPQTGDWVEDSRQARLLLALIMVVASLSLRLLGMLGG